MDARALHFTTYHFHVIPSLHTHIIRECTGLIYVRKLPVSRGFWPIRSIYHVPCASKLRVVTIYIFPFNVPGDHASTW